MKTLILSAWAAAALVAAAQTDNSTLCDALSASVHAASSTSAGGSMWSRLTTGATPAMELATVPELSLEANPEPDSRVQFEKRFRALYGNAQAVLKDLSAWDNFAIFGLPGSAVRMLVTTNDADDCESRYFFRVTVSRDVVRLPDPTAGSPAEPEHLLCEKRGGFGYLARVNRVDAFVEYYGDESREAIRIIPLTSAGWQRACSIHHSAAHRPS
jgi:hypothetical protein